MIVTRYEVWCEHEASDCPENDQPPSGHDRSEARHEARARGYRRRVVVIPGPGNELRDYCPEHDPG